MIGSLNWIITQQSLERSSLFPVKISQKKISTIGTQMLFIVGLLIGKRLRKEFLLGFITQILMIFFLIVLMIGGRLRRNIGTEKRLKIHMVEK